MRAARNVSTWFVCLSLVGLGCGSDSEDSGVSCGGGFEACGGSVEGSWKLEDACFIILEQPDSECGATTDLKKKSATGSLTFDDDLYERHIELETELSVRFPKECTQADGQTRDCSDYESTLRTGTRLSCSEADDGGCDCTTTVTSTFNDEGPYTFRGTHLDLSAESLDYCAKDQTLTLQPTVSINMAGTPVTSKLVTTFTKN